MFLNIYFIMRDINFKCKQKKFKQKNSDRHQFQVKLEYTLN